MENRYAKAEMPQIAQKIGEKAYQALLEEVYTTPKPGLVDLFSNGAHRDMNVKTFEKSAKALYPWFVRMAAQGLLLTCEPEELFFTIRKTGVLAEQAMFQATEGVNTHKGLIFTLGIFCAAAGRCMREHGMLTLDTLIEIQQKMTARVLQKEIEQLTEEMPVSNGIKNLKKYGTAGIRGEAMDGYRSVTELALPVLRQGLCEKKDWNLIKLQVLFTLMSQVEDSNILARKNPQTLKQVQNEAKEFLTEGGAYSQSAMKRLCLMDGDYIERNISAGGCADLLATTIFLEMLLQGGDYDYLRKTL